MKRTWGILLLFCLCFMSGCGSGSSEGLPQNESEQEMEQTEKTAEELKEEFLEKKLAEMSLEEKTGQLFMCAFRKNEDGSNITEMNQTIKDAFDKYHVGNVILFGENIDTVEQTKGLISDLQAHSSIPLLVGVDEEGGRVSRLHASGNIPAADIPSAEELAAEGDSQKVFEAGKTIGQELKELGFQVDFAPVADINTNPDNTVIGNRAFGSDGETAATMVSAFLKGLKEEGIVGCVKHFPGHGDTSMDSHKNETYVAHDRERLKKVEFLPFQRAIGEQVDMVMVSHIKTPNATTDGLPASLSKEMVTDILRKELGFQGIIITDAMNMGAIAHYYGGEEAAVMALEAGVDIILMPENYEKAVSAVLEAVREGRLTEGRITESAKRILSLKYDKGLFAEAEGK